LRVVGLDFGDPLSIALYEGHARRGRFVFSRRRAHGRTPAFRSILHFEPDPDDLPDDAEGQALRAMRHDSEGQALRAMRRPPRVRSGPAAIDRYLETAGDGRLVQSIKSFLASALFERTEIFGAIYELEDLVGRLVAELRAAAERDLGPLGRRVVVGRPVRLAGDAATADERLALARLRSALARAGFDEVVFELEPVAAAHHYGLRIEAPELVLIGDFGGGTSDFSVLRLAPGGGRAHAEVLATAGVGIAGDAFDARLVRERVAPALGRGTSYRNPFGDVLPVPRWLYAHLERWHHLSFLNRRRRSRCSPISNARLSNPSGCAPHATGGARPRSTSTARSRRRSTNCRASRRVVCAIETSPSRSTRWWRDATSRRGSRSNSNASKPASTRRSRRQAAPTRASTACS
jgi:hypothetical protein